jgi:hypothetical protein
MYDIAQVVGRFCLRCEMYNKWGKSRAIDRWCNGYRAAAAEEEVFLFSCWRAYFFYFCSCSLETDKHILSITAATTTTKKKENRPNDEETNMSS